MSFYNEHGVKVNLTSSSNHVTMRPAVTYREYPKRFMAELGILIGMLLVTGISIKALFEHMLNVLL